MPGDNPVYGVGTGDADCNNAAELNGDITWSSGERDFDNPIYGGDMMEEYDSDHWNIRTSWDTTPH